MKSTSSDLSCASCGSETVIQIELRLTDGTEVEFYSCDRCEARWWNRDGEELDLDMVLDLARRPPA